MRTEQPESGSRTGISLFLLIPRIDLHESYRRWAPATPVTTLGLFRRLSDPSPVERFLSHGCGLDQVTWLCEQDGKEILVAVLCDLCLRVVIAVFCLERCCVELSAGLIDAHARG